MQATLEYSTQIDREAWDNLVFSSPQGSVFITSSFLDIILPNGWCGIMVTDGSGLQAVMPINICTKWGIRYALQPMFTKYWGIAFRHRQFQSPYHQYSWKKKIINVIINCIPAHIASFEYNCHPGFDYSLPFTWKSFHANVRYTYILDVKAWDTAQILNSYAGPMKNSLRQAEKNSIKVVKDTSVNSLLSILKQNIKEGKKLMKPPDYKTLHNVFSAGSASGQCFVLTAFNAENTAVASALYLKDEKCIYSVVHCQDKKYSHTDGFSLITHHAIIISAQQKLNFDFLGSMIEPVESAFRKFNGTRIMYYNISRKNLLVRLLLK